MFFLRKLCVFLYALKCFKINCLAPSTLWVVLVLIQHLLEVIIASFYVCKVDGFSMVSFYDHTISYGHMKHVIHTRWLANPN